jgi:hypothetical protein
VREYSLRDLMVIRAANVAGAAMFGGVIYWLHHQNNWSPAAPDPMLRYLPMAAIAIALVGMFIFRPIWAKAGEPARRNYLSIVGWAMGEGAALAGGVYYFLTDDARFYITGMFVLLASLMLFPIKRPD